jgi:RNA polymerase sigma-70 factor (ECF subfamily)
MVLVRSDQLLLNLWRRGDLTAGEELFERHYDLVYRFFSREVTADVAPLVQETFTACLEGRRPMDPEASFRAHLLATAYELLAAHLQKETGNQGAIRGDESTETDLASPREGRYSPGEILEGSTVPDPDSSPDQQAEQQRRRALRSLSFVDRVLIELHDFEGISERDKAEVFGIPVTSVRAQLRRAHQQLREAMERLARGETADELEPTFAHAPADDSSPWEQQQGYSSRLADGGPLELIDTGDDEPPGGPHLPRVRMEIVLDGDIAQVTPDTRRRLRFELERSVPAGDLTVERIRQGSIIVELEASPEAAAMLERLFESGDLASLAGLRILAIKRVHAELPAPAAAGIERAEAALADFLVSAFAADELRRFVHGVSDGARLEAALPGAPASLSHLAFEAARVLVRHGLVGPALFERLEAERPGRRDEIHQLRQAFEHAADAAPARPPP